METAGNLRKKCLKIPNSTIKNVMLCEITKLFSIHEGSGPPTEPSISLSPFQEAKGKQQCSTAYRAAVLQMS
jgi:hypothetical protein